MKSFYKIFLIAAIISLISEYGFGQDSLKQNLKKSNSESGASSFVSLQGTYVRHLGDFGKVWSHSTGAYATYGYNYTGNYVLNFKIGYLTTHKNKNIDFPDNSSMTIIPLIVGGKYYFDLGRVQPYLAFNNGINLVIQKVDLDGEPDEKSMQKYYCQFGAGTYIGINKNLKIDFSVNLNSHFYQDDAMMTGFEYMLGLQYDLTK